MTQARIAETEKYAHVTFFFNGGVEEPNEGEDRILVKSPKVATYDLTAGDERTGSMRQAMCRQSVLRNMMSSSSTLQTRIWLVTPES